MCTEVTYESFHWAGNFSESIEAWNICFRHTADMTSTIRSGLQIPSGPGDLPFDKFFINLMRPSVVISIRAAAIISMKSD